MHYPYNMYELVDIYHSSTTIIDCCTIPSGYNTYVTKKTTAVVDVSDTKYIQQYSSKVYERVSYVCPLYFCTYGMYSRTLVYRYSM